MAIPIFLAAIGGFITMTASRVVSVVAGRKLAEKKPPTKPTTAPVKKDDRLRKAEDKYLKDKNDRETELLNIQADLANMREIEIKANFEIAKAQADMDERSLEISERSLKLKRQELDLIKARLKQDEKIAESQMGQVEKSLGLREREIALMEAEINEKNKLGYLHLELQREQEVNKISLKLTELQKYWDLENWAGIVSREEMKRLLVEGQTQHRLLMMISPPDITDCPEFNTNLQKEVRSEVKEFLETHYPLNTDVCPVEYYGKFFKTAIFDAEVKQLESDLSPIPTVVIYSDVTDQKVYFHVTFWGLENSLSLTLPWHWREEQQKLIEQGLSIDDSLMTIRRSIIKIHQLIAAFLADLYYLNINPLHQPRLLEMETDIPTEWMQANLGMLKDIQEQRLAKYRKELAKENFDPIQLFFG